MIDLDVLIGFRRDLPVDEAKRAIQDYAAGYGIRVKRQFAIDKMIELVLEAADEKINEEMEAVATMAKPKSDTDNSVLVEDEDKPSVVQDAVDGFSEFMETDDIKALMPGAPIERVSELEPGYDTIGYSKPIPIQEYFSPEQLEKLAEQISPMHIQGAVAPEKKEFRFPDDFRPMNLIGKNPAFLNVPYWVLDWIVQTKDWKLNMDTYPHTDVSYIQTILYYIRMNGSICVRESRNSQYHHLY